jgi:hypothetical protein
LSPKLCCNGLLLLWKASFDDEPICDDDFINKFK